MKPTEKKRQNSNSRKSIMRLMALVNETYSVFWVTEFIITAEFAQVSQTENFPANFWSRDRSSNVFAAINNSAVQLHKTSETVFLNFKLDSFGQRYASGKPLHNDVRQPNCVKSFRG